MFVEHEVSTSHHSPHNLMIYKMLTSHALHTFGKEFVKNIGKPSITHYIIYIYIYLFIDFTITN